LPAYKILFGVGQDNSSAIFTLRNPIFKWKANPNLIPNHTNSNPTDLLTITILQWEQCGAKP